MSPRPRQSASLPNGIKPEALPNYVYWDATGKGRWLLKTYDRATRKTSTKRLAGPKATLREIWDAYEAHTQEPPKALTVRSLIEMFEASPQWVDLAETTRRDYRICAVFLSLLQDRMSDREILKVLSQKKLRAALAHFRCHAI